MILGTTRFSPLAKTVRIRRRKISPLYGVRSPKRPDFLAGFSSDWSFDFLVLWEDCDDMFYLNSIM
jgi:hypothetical protein